MIFCCRIFYFQQWRPSWLGAFNSPDPKGHVSICYHWASVVNLLYFHILLWNYWANWDYTWQDWWCLGGPLSELYSMIPLPTKMAMTKIKMLDNMFLIYYSWKSNPSLLCGNIFSSLHWWYCLIGFIPLHVSRPSVRPSVRPSLTFCILIFSSETTGPIGTKLGKIDGACVVPFQNCIRWSRSQPRWPPLQVVSKGRKISWLAGGVIGYDSERGYTRTIPPKSGPNWSS
jgi:hypothetical protein